MLNGNIAGIVVWIGILIPKLKNITTMADDKQKTTRQDAIRVDSNDPSEVEYLHSQHPDKTHQEVLDAVKKYGPMREDIEANLKKG